MSSVFPAHIRFVNGVAEIQSVEDHCRATAELAEAMLSSVGLAPAGKLAGLLHDMGKCKNEFREYICGVAGTKGQVVHTFIPVRYLMESFACNEEDDYEALTAELLAYAVGAHHGLFDLQGSRIEHGFEHRCNDHKEVGYKEACNNFFNRVSKEEIAELFKEAEATIQSIVNRVNDSISNVDDTMFSFYLGLLARLLLSSVIDADRTDTADYMLFRETQKYTPPNWQLLLEHVETKLSMMPDESELSKARSRISLACREFAKRPGSIIRLNVPTGGGKTLSSLRYALAHCMHYKKERIIFTAPLLTILEQNAAVIRDFVGDDSVILEHHSNVITERNTGENFDLYESMLDSWNSPIIITTMVQLFNTMFSSKTSCVRRFHSLCNSVIVIDEVQTVPIKLLSMFNITISFLSEFCGATVVLCSATQPEYSSLQYHLPQKIPEMVPYDADLWNVFRRTELIDKGQMKLEEVPSFADSVIRDKDSLLIVCNTKKEAAYLYKELSVDERRCFHLSASMCPQHRRDTLKHIRESLSQGVKTICVSTQVIEAGVDISFGSVIRLSAGLDSIVQSAGRCNRNGEQATQAPVYIVTVLNEQLTKLKDIKRNKDSVLGLLERYRTCPERFDNDLSSAQAVTEYYSHLYSELSIGEADFSVNGGTLLDLLSDNKKYCQDETDYLMNQAFKTAGDLFSVFDDDTLDVLVPYRDGKELISSIESANAAERAGLLKKARAYSVSVFRYQREKLEKNGGLRWICDGTIAVLSEQEYSDKIGLLTEEKMLDFLGV